VLYLSEAAPAHLRGAMVTGFQAYLLIGQILGSVVDNYTQVRTDRLSYQIPLIVLYIVPVFLSLVNLIIPESPRWLLEKDRVEDAKVALLKLYGNGVPESLIDAQIKETSAAIQAEKALGHVDLIELFCGTDLVCFLHLLLSVFQPHILVWTQSDDM